MPDKGPLKGAFNRPFAEQVAAFRTRLGELVPTARWDDISRSAHDRAFMVAGAMKADLLADLAGAVDKAVSQGTGLEAFRAEFREIVTRRGWHGWTGEGTKAGEAWRTRVIYRTNMATSYAAGRRAQLEEGGYPLWVYRHGGSRDPRPEHLAWDGLTLPADHPFWATHSPPNGWGCSCYVLGARSERAAARLGGNPDVEPGDDWRRPDPRTGAPKGLDKGWDYAPGASATDTILSLRDKLDHLPERPSIDLIQDWLAMPAFGAWLQAPAGRWPLARLAEADARAIGARTTVADLPAEAALAQLRAHPGLSARDYALAQGALSAPTASRAIDAGSMVFLRELADGSGDVLAVTVALGESGPTIDSLRRLTRAEAAQDSQLRGLLGR